MTLYDELVWRGLIKDESSPELRNKINEGKMTFYIGTDPTGPSLHIGHYLSFSMSRRLQAVGHKPILLVGGATGLIGDPKPNAGERPMITKEELDFNYKKLRAQVEKVFKGFEVVNNYDWTKDINVVDFLRDYGKYFPINYMLDKDTVKSRLEIGITYTEFSYMLLQALDFVWLYENKGVELQMGGQDQWGNITAGIELGRKKYGYDLYGFTMPLVTKADGTKFGKSESGAIWLDKEMTSPYEMYQFFINVEDSMVIDYLKKFTFYSVSEIKELELKHNEHPELREAHKALAKDVIIFLHGEEEYENAVKMSESLFSDDIWSLSADDIIVRFNDVPKFSLKEEIGILDLLVNNEICSSRREAREMLTAGAILINNKKIEEDTIIINNKLAIDNKVLVIRKGKKKYYLGIFN